MDVPEGGAFSLVPAHLVVPAGVVLFAVVLSSQAKTALFSAGPPFPVQVPEIGMRVALEVLVKVGELVAAMFVSSATAVRLSHHHHPVPPWNYKAKRYPLDTSNLLVACLPAVVLSVVP